MPMRAEKIARQYLREISTVINTEVKDPSLGFVTVTDVKMSRDLSRATIFVSILGEEQDKKNTIAALKRAKGFIRREMAGRVRLRFAPELEFELDISAEDLNKTLQLIESIEKGKKGEK
jgi:ribosome-binding factor A